MHQPYQPKMSFRICHATAVAVSRPTQIPQPVLVRSRSGRRGRATITPRKYVKFVKATKIPRPVVGHGQAEARKYTKARCIVTKRLPPVYEETVGSSPLAMTPQPTMGLPAIVEEEGSSPVVTTSAAFEERAGSRPFDAIPGPNSGDGAYSFDAPGGGRHSRRVARAIGRFFCF